MLCCTKKPIKPFKAPQDTVAILLSAGALENVTVAQLLMPTALVLVI
jgi:hypothetical protein